MVDVLDRVAPMWALQLPSLFDSAQTESLRSRVLGGTNERMQREGADLFEAIAERFGAVLAVEDIHWADPSTLSLLDWLSDRAGGPLRIVCTYRPGESAGGQADALVDDLVSRALATRIELGPLDPPSIAEIVTDHLGEVALEPAVGQLVTEHSGGNPLHAIELVDGWRGDGLLEVDSATATAAVDVDELQAAVPETIRSSIARSLARLTPEVREILEAASVIGQLVPGFLVAAAVDEPVDTTETRLGELARQGRWVTAVGDDRWPDGTVSTVFRLTHDLHLQVLLDEIPAGRRGRLHHRVALRLEAAWAHRAIEHASDLASHFRAAGDAPRMVRYFHAAGEAALARGAHAEALELFDQALEVLPDLESSEERVQLEIALRASRGPALIATAGWAREEVEENYRRALTLCASPAPSPERFVVRYGLASVHELRGEFQRSEELLREQLADGDGLGVETRELLACTTFHQGSFAASLDHAMNGLDVWDQSQHSTYMARYGEHPGVSCNTWGALSAWFLGDVDRAVRMADEAVEWGAANPHAITTAQIQAGFLRHFMDDAEASRGWAEQTQELAVLQGFPFRHAQAETLLGWCDAVQGAPEEGHERIERGLDACRDLGARMDEPHFLGLRAATELLLGDADGCRRTIEEARGLARFGSRSFFYEPELARLEATAILAAGGPEAEHDAAAVIRSGIDTAERFGARMLVLRLALDAAEAGLTDVPTSGAESIAALAAGITGPETLPDLVRARAALDRPAR